MNNYADYESVFLASVIACDERTIKEYLKYINKIVAPTLDAVCSCSGFRLLPDVHKLGNFEEVLLVMIRGCLKKNFLKKRSLRTCF